MNIHPKNKDALSGNLLVGGNSPDAKPLAVLAELDTSASAIASAPLPHFRWDGIANCGSKMRGWLELPPSSPTPCQVRGFGLPFLAALRSLRRSIELLEVPATPRKQYTQTIAQESATDMVWAGRWAGAFYQFTGADYRVGVKLPIATESMAKFCAANCVMPISLTAPLKS
jgi:hypothetical protein